jgi:hypothetical protein
MRKLLPLVAFGTMAFMSPAAHAGTADDCAYELQPISRTGDRILAEPVLIGCFDTYAEALEAGSEGAIQVSSDATPLTLSASLDLNVTLSSSVLIGTEWDGSQYAGQSKSYFASGTCSSSVTWEVGYVTDAWNDLFNSGKGFGACDRNRKFEHSNFGGSSVLCTPNCSGYGSLSNQVSSLRWSA